ncbi:MAG TPA: ABC transporter permease [Candidatus Obscuribacterales bacterium]
MASVQEKTIVRQTDEQVQAALLQADSAAVSTQHMPAEGHPEVESGDYEHESFFAFALRTYEELRQFKFALFTFVMNTLSRRYRRSVLGFAWSLLNPLLTMVVMSVVFASLFKRDLHHFSMFIFSGVLPWQFIQTTITSSTQSILANETFLKKLYNPRAFFPLANVCVEAFNFAFSLASLFILAAIFGLSVKATSLLLPIVIGITCIFLCGASLIMAIATVYFRDLAHITTVVLSVMFYMMPVMYPPDKLSPKLLLFFQFNPFYHIIRLYRQVIYEGVLPGVVDWLIPTLTAFGALLIGLYLLKRTERDLVFRL